MDLVLFQALSPSLSRLRADIYFVQILNSQLEWWDGRCLEATYIGDRGRDRGFNEK